MGELVDFLASNLWTDCIWVWELSRGLFIINSHTVSSLQLINVYPISQFHSSFLHLLYLYAHRSPKKTVEFHGKIDLSLSLWVSSISEVTTSLWRLSCKIHYWVSVSMTQSMYYGKWLNMKELPWTSSGL